jgi:hypothetical protein
LDELVFSHNKIKSFSSKDLPKSLKSLSIGYNNISRIPELTNLKNLHFLDLSYNRLSNPLDVDQFKKMNNIYVNVYGNPFCAALKEKKKIGFIDETQTELCPNGATFRS